MGLSYRKHWKSPGVGEGSFSEKEKTPAVTRHPKRARFRAERREQIAWQQVREALARDSRRKFRTDGAVRLDSPGGSTGQLALPRASALAASSSAPA